MKIALAADHAGFEMKRDLAGKLAKDGHEVLDLGTHSSAAVDYPDYAEAVADMLREGQAERGVIVCGSGAGVSIAASRFLVSERPSATIPTRRTRQSSTTT
jgi:ribose 5-phosphate isomerase B